ncbi:MAG: adenosylcobinamide amidohydrolase [Nitrospiraceae bacterium]
MAAGRAQNCRLSHALFDVRLSEDRQTLIVDLQRPCAVLSSAPCRGGFVRARYLLNHQVAANAVHPSRRETVPSHSLAVTWPTPASTLRGLARSLGLREVPVGLMTAVPMTKYVSTVARRDGQWVRCLTTVGVTNAVAAGEWPAAIGKKRRTRALGGQGFGTINLIVLIGSTLTPSAMVGAVQVATETKTAVLREQCVQTARSKPATGTGTDAVAIAVGLDERAPCLEYSGTHTLIGALIARVVRTSVERGLAKARRWDATHRPASQRRRRV